MNVREMRTASPARSPAAGLHGIRRESFAIAVLLLVQFGLGIGVNLFVTLPRPDHGAGLGAALANGPAAVSIYIVLGLAMIVTALVIAVQAIVARQGGIIALAVLGTAGLTSAAINGTRFAGSGQNTDSMAMALAWAVAMLCYLSILFITGRPARR